MNIAWFSCGITSAIACKIALLQLSDVHVIYIDTRTCHNDNERFISDCEKWYGVKIERYTNEKYDGVLDVIRKRKFINSPYGAVCTFELKKKVRFQIEKIYPNFEHQVFGFDFCKKEINRAIRFEQQYPAARPLFPLIENGVTKEKCFTILQKYGIQIPTMYTLGFPNNNCIGCVKGGMGYWNLIRKKFPLHFSQMAKIERDLGATCIRKNGKPFFLDTLKENDGVLKRLEIPECDLFCEVDFQNVRDPLTDIIFKQNVNKNFSI